MKAEISDGANCLLSRPCTHASPLPALTILYGTMPMSFWVMGSSKRRPISRLMAKKVNSGLVTPWRLAGWPIRRSPSGAKATMEGVVRAPSAFSMTLGADPSITATQELVVPRSMPITLAILFLSRGRWGPDPNGVLRPIPLKYITNRGLPGNPCSLQGVYRVGGWRCQGGDAVKARFSGVEDAQSINKP